MEYERALFRVYDKSMEGLQSRSARSACWYAQKTLLVISAGLFATLALLHHQFVDEPGCIASLIEDAARREGLLLVPSDVVDGGPADLDAVATTSVNATTGADAAGVQGGTGVDGADHDEDEGEDDEEEDTRVVLLPSGAMIPHDVMIGIAIGEGGGGGSRSRRVWGLRGSRSGRAAEGARRLEGDFDIIGGWGPGTDRVRALVDGDEEEGDGAESDIAVDTSKNSTAATRVESNFPADYIFSYEPMVLLLPEQIRNEHEFRWLNFTMEPSECLEKAGAPARFLASKVIGYDMIMVNMLMLSSWSKGMLRNTETHAQWHWLKRTAAASGWLDRVIGWVSFKVEVVLSSVLAFVLVSTVTAMTVRTLLSSGVVIMFPLVMLMERLGLTIEGVHQTLALSYPWLGMPIEHLRNRNKPVMPFIMGHIMQILVLYSVYNASLLAWSLWLYGKPMTNALQLWLYGMVMLWEYFALIFVRSRSSIVFFSRMAALSFLAFHVYFYHFEAGYFAIAAGACFTAMFAVKLYVLQYLELPAYMSGEISHDEPRAHFVELPWSTWDAALPPMWSLFIPPNASTVGVYGDTVPDRPGAVEAGDDEEEEPNTQPLARGGLRSRGRGRGRGRAVAETAERRRSRVRRVPGRGGGVDDAEEGVEMATRRRRTPGVDVEEG